MVVPNTELIRDNLLIIEHVSKGMQDGKEPNCQQAATRVVSCCVEGVRALRASGVLGVMYSYRTALVYESSMMVRHSVNGVT